MNTQHKPLININQRNHNNNNNNNNMTQSQYKGYGSKKGSTAAITHNGHNHYRNSSHSSSMSEITDNFRYQQAHGQTSQKTINSFQRNQHGSGSQQSQLYQTSLVNSEQESNGKSGQLSWEARRDQREKREKEFIPSFLLIDACKTNNERKVKEICKRLSSLSDEETQPVANFQDQTGRTSLSFACGGGSVTLVDELSRIKCLDPNIGDNDGNTPLHYAAQAGHSEAVDMMLARFQGGLDVNCRNSTGLTPLMKAALQGRTRCAKSLLSAGASSHLRDYSRNMTAAEWARLCGRHICAEIITRCAKDNRHSSSPGIDRFPTNANRTLPGSRSMDLKRVSSDESPYYHLYARSTVSGATWLKNKIKKALGASGASTSSNPSVRSLADRRPSVSEGNYALMSHLSGATICAGSLLLPSIKPLIDQQRPKPITKKFTIPTLQVTPDKR